MTLACSIWSPTVIALCVPLSAAAECPLESRRTEWNGPLCSLLSVSPWPDLAVFHEPADPLWKARSRASRTRGRHSDPLILGFLQVLRELGKARTHWPHKTQALLFTEGRPVSLRVRVASSRHWIQGDLLEENLVLTSLLVRFIGRKSGAHRINRRQRNRLGKGAQDQGNPDRGSLEQSGQDVRLGWLHTAPHYPRCPLGFASWPQRQRSS